jgi:hypothetical protein
MTYVLPRLMKDSFNEMEELFMHMSYDQSMQHTVVDCGGPRFSLWAIWVGDL